MTSGKLKDEREELELESKKFNFHLHIQLIHQGFCMSAGMKKLGSLFEYLLFNDPTEYVVLNDMDQTYSKLKREYYVWFGERMPRESKLPVRTKRISKFKELLQLSTKLKHENVTIMLFFYLDDQQKSIEQLNLEALNNICLFPVSKYNSIDKHMKKIGENGSGHKQKLFLSNFYQLSSDIKSQINKQKFNLYWMLAGQNIVQAYLDFYNFFKYFLEEENVQSEKMSEELRTYRSEYENSSFMRTSQMQILFYTKSSYFHKIINNSLRTFVNAEDFAYIRFPFLRIFLTVNELFIMQAEQKFREDSFFCYRGCTLAQSQIKLLLNSVNKYVQITTFLSTSMQKQIALTFGADLVIIEVPPVHKSMTMVHSFASIKHYSSFYAQQEILFNPLNIFKVSRVEKNQKSYIINLQYINTEEIQRKNIVQLTEEDKNLIENYKFQKQMLRVNRNQGEYLWRLLQQQNATKYYQQKFKIHLKEAKRHLGPYQTHQTSNNRIIGKLLYNQLKIFVKDFQWFQTQQQNLKLIDVLIQRNTKRSVQLYLYTSKIHEYALNYQRALSYLLVSSIKAKKIISPNSIAYYFILSCLGLSLMNLDQIGWAKRIFHEATSNLARTCNIDKIYYPFIIVPAVLSYQTKDLPERSQIQILFRKCVENMEPYGLVDHPWLKFIQKFEDIMVVKQFVEYYTKTYDKMLFFIRRQIFYTTEQVLFEFENIDCQYALKDQFYFRKNQQLNQKLAIAGELLQKSKSNSKSEVSYVNCLFHTVKLALNHNLTILTTEQFLKNWTREEQQVSKLASLSYYQFRLHVISLKYITKMVWFLNLRSVKSYKFNTAHFYDVFQTIMTKFRNKYYLHLLFIIDVCQFCMYRNFNRLFLKFVKILIGIQKKVGQILSLHLNQILFLKKMLKRKIFQIHGYSIS